MTKHFVIFYSPGTFIAESSEKQIGSWDVKEACRMAAEITERYGAIPYGFSFKTVEQNDGEWGLKESARSGLYYINCRVLTLEEVKARNDPAERILVSNMECNGWNEVVQTITGWRWTQPLQKGDTVISPGEEFEAVISRGD